MEGPAMLVLGLGCFYLYTGACTTPETVSNHAANQVTEDSFD